MAALLGMNYEQSGSFAVNRQIDCDIDFSLGALQNMLNVGLLSFCGPSALCATFCAVNLAVVT